MLFSAFRFGKTYDGESSNRHPVVKVFIVLGFVLLGIIAVTALAIVFGLVVQWLWNALMPVIFNLPEVTYWQAVGLVVLGHILFGSHNHNHSSRSKVRGRSSRSKRDNHSDEKHVYINKNGHECHYDSFREFWNDYGRDAFDKWLNRNEPKLEPEDVQG